MLRNLTLFWLASLLVLTLSQIAITGLSAIDLSVMIKSLTPLIICALFIGVMQYQHFSIPYLLFFSISLTSFIGVTQTLTGSHVASTNVFLYVLSFYTASLAYLISTQSVTLKSTLIVSNPLLLVTGPIATQFGSIRYRKFGKRLGYYFPYVLLGIFLHQAIATPLTQTFPLLNKTDVVSSLTFAVIFELFVYANFCGLSLIVYGIAGVIGFRVPLNFKQPFSSTNVIDFWRGWHTSLSLVLKTLFYTPTRKKIGPTFAILCVYLASAMWHGITFNFLLWGTLHAVVFILTIWFLRRKNHVLPFVLFVFSIIVGRILFTESNTDRLLTKLAFEYVDFSVFDRLLNIPNTSKLSLILVSLFVLSEFGFQRTRFFRQRNYKFYRIPVIQFILLMITLMTITKGVGVDYAVYGQR